MCVETATGRFKRSVQPDEFCTTDVRRSSGPPRGPVPTIPGASEPPVHRLHASDGRATHGRPRLSSAHTCQSNGPAATRIHAATRATGMKLQLLW